MNTSVRLRPVGPDHHIRAVHAFLEESRRRAPDRTAVVCGDRRRTYEELDNAANQLANGLIDRGLGAGHCVAIYLDNSIETVVSIFGVLKAGATFTVINPSTKVEKLASILWDEQASLLIADNTQAHRQVILRLVSDTSLPAVVWVGGVPPGIEPNTTVFLNWEDLLIGNGEFAPPVATTEGDLGTIIYTSGTTGTSKGVMSAHGDMTFATCSIASYLCNTPDDVIFCCLPLAFTYGLYQLLTAVSVGATLILERNFAFPARALELMARERVTGFPAVPTTLALLMGLRSFSRYDLRSLRYITNAAAPLPLNRISALREAFPNVEFFSMYGQTECKRACYLPPEDLEERPGSVGIPIPGTGVMVVDRQGHPVARGTVGELVVMGPHVMRGYWGKPLETAQRLRPSPVTGEKILYTGDLFRMDDDGYLYFVSRADDIIKTRGEKVSPTEVEMGLYPLPGVREVAATGVPDPILGEAIAVFISREEGATLTARDVRAYCARHLEDVMIPTYVEFCDELPRSDTGKVLRRRLLQMTREEEHADAGH